MKRYKVLVYVTAQKWQTVMVSEETGKGTIRKQAKELVKSQLERHDIEARRLIGSEIEEIENE